MSIAYSTDWEIRTTGDYSNGGGFNRESGGTDYTQQDVAQLALTDCATSGVGSTTLTSATGGFTAAMVGNIINLSAGTNLTVNWYEITAYTDTNTVTIDRAPDDGVGGVSGATGKVGGAMSWPPPDVTDGGPTVTYNKFWIKHGTYTLTNTTVSAENGPISLDYANVEGFENVRGDLGSKPVFSAGTQVPSTGTTIFRTFTQSVAIHITNIKVDGVDNTRTFSGFALTDYRNFVQHCEAVNCQTGFAGNNNSARFCKASNCQTGFSSFKTEFCVAHDCTSVGINNYINEAYHCLVYNCPIGYYLNGGADVTRCIADNCTDFGIYHYASYGNSLENLVTNCGTGIYFRGVALSSDKNYLYNNSADVLYGGNNPASRYVSYDSTSITSDPYVDAANGKYALNEDETGGQVVKNAWAAAGSSEIYSIFYPKVYPQDTSISSVADGEHFYPFRHLVADDFYEDPPAEGTSDDYLKTTDHTHRPLFKFSIGSGEGRDFSSLSAFASAFDNTLIDLNYAKVVVTCHNDTGTDEWVMDTNNVSIQTPTNCFEFVLTVADDSWHKGEYGKGVVLRRNSTPAGYDTFLAIGCDFGGTKLLIERLFIDINGYALQSAAGIVFASTTNTGQTVKFNVVRDCVIRGTDGTYCGARWMTGITSTSRPMYVESCIVYNLLSNGAGSSVSSTAIGGDDAIVTNNTVVYGVDFANTSGTNYGIAGSHTIYGAVTNSISMNVNGNCLYSSSVASNAITDDSTGDVQSSAAVEFVDAANGDFRLRSGSIAAGSGPQLSSNCLMRDITGKLRSNVIGVTTDAGPFNNIAGYDQEVRFPTDPAAESDYPSSENAGTYAYPFRQFVETAFEDGTTRPTHPLRST